MKFLILAFLLPTVSLAEELALSKGKAVIEVKAVIKRVSFESDALKGKIVCKDDCEYLLAVPVKTFSSSDSNRDLNMRETIDAEKFPYATAKGKIAKSALEAATVTVDAQVDFHGVTKTYPITIKDRGSKASFRLDLEAHKVVRPSFMTVKVDNDVPVNVDLAWKKD